MTLSYDSVVDECGKNKYRPISFAPFNSCFWQHWSEWYTLFSKKVDSLRKTGLKVPVFIASLEYKVIKILNHSLGTFHNLILRAVTKKRELVDI